MHFLVPNSHLPKLSTQFGVFFQVLQAEENAETDPERGPDGCSVNLKRAFISSEMQLRSASVRSKILHPFDDPYPSDDE